jgi:peptidoglycan hydrolase-like protein with peptidoglycan-binding domain
VPPRSQLLRFLATADALGAPAVSFWDWQEANAEAWDAIRDAPQGMLPTEPATFTPGQVRAYQTLLSSLGFSAPLTGVLDETAKAAIEAFQRAAHLPVTGRIDPFTRALMLSPKAPPTSP